MDEEPGAGKQRAVSQMAAELPQVRAHRNNPRTTRIPTITITSCVTYDFLISLLVALAQPEYDYADYDVGREWVESARARCIEADAHAYAMLQRYVGDGRPESLHFSLMSLVAKCPNADTVLPFLDWLATYPTSEFVAALLDEQNEGDEWRELLQQALTEQRQGVASAPSAKPTATQRILATIEAPLRPTVESVLKDPEAIRARLVAALRVWYTIVFAPEQRRIQPLLKDEAANLERLRTERTPTEFLDMAMRGVEWQLPRSLRAIIFAPSYFCSPAIYYHALDDVLTFCFPVASQLREPQAQPRDPSAPSTEVLSFFEVLGDRSRLRILKLLSHEEMYLTQIAQRLGLKKATTKHHMVRLRIAGLVTVVERERMTFYTLRPNIVNLAARYLAEHLDLTPEV